MRPLLIIALLFAAVAAFAGAPRLMTCPKANFVRNGTNCDCDCYAVDGGLLERVTDGGAQCPPELLRKPSKFDPQHGSP